MGEMIKGISAGPLTPDAEPLFGPHAHRRKATMLDMFRGGAEPLNYTVFLAEDNRDARGAMLQVLQRSPYICNVHWFDNGDAMLKHFVQEGYAAGRLFRNIPTLVLVNEKLPGINGLDVLRRLKENPHTANIVVALMTDDYTSALAAEAQRLKANALLAKPLSLARIHEVMQTGSGWHARDL